MIPTIWPLKYLNQQGEKLMWMSIHCITMILVVLNIDHVKVARYKTTQNTQKNAYYNLSTIKQNYNLKHKVKPLENKTNA